MQIVAILGEHLEEWPSKVEKNLPVRLWIFNFEIVYLAYYSTIKCSLTRLNLSANCWGGWLNWVYIHHFWCVHPPTAGTLGFIKSYQSLTQIQVYWAPSVFYFSDNSLVLWYSSCFCIVLYSHYGHSISNEKLNGHQAVESWPLRSTCGSFQRIHFIIIYLSLLNCGWLLIREVQWFYWTQELLVPAEKFSIRMPKVRLELATPRL